MAKSRRRKARGGGGSDAGWKKSKGLAVGLVVGILVLWIYMFGGGSSHEIPKIPQAYWDSEAKAVFVTDEPLRGYPPYEHPKTGDDSLWEAWTCTNEKCKEKGEDGKPPIFPRIVKLPKGVEPPAEGEEPSMEFEQAYMEAEMSMPKCKHCKKEEFATRYMTPEAQKIIEEIREKYKKKRKKK
ncbi:MAG: hypothetical protein ACYTGH_11540 [Planctomycetota bacterium]|jgi:hypothetical protein